MSEENVKVITVKEMDGDGGFNCPRCGIRISPDLEEEHEVVNLEVKDGDLNIRIKHLCGQEMLIDM